MSETKPVVGIIMGSNSDWPTMKAAAKMLEDFGVPFEAKVVSAHRTPERLFDFARGAKRAGFKVIIAGAGGAAHLPGMAAAMTTLPVLGVPVESKLQNGLDSLLSIVQMPAGVPVGTLAVGAAGAKNAGLKQAIERVLKLKVIDLKTDPQLMGALGAAEYARQKGMAR